MPLMIDSADFFFVFIGGVIDDHHLIDDEGKMDSIRSKTMSCFLHPHSLAAFGVKG